MHRIAVISAVIALCAPCAMAEIIQTEPSCAYTAAHTPANDVAADDLNGPVALSPLELELRRYIPVRAAWFLEAALGTIRVDLQTGAVTGQGGTILSATSQQPACE